MGWWRVELWDSVEWRDGMVWSYGMVEGGAMGWWRVERWDGVELWDGVGWSYVMVEVGGWHTCEARDPCVPKVQRQTVLPANLLSISYADQRVLSH